MENVSPTKDSVKEYYGKILQTSDDLLTDACCTAEGMPDFAKPILSRVHEEVLSKYYGCGIIIPEQLKDCSVLDLGSGSGRDCYVLSYLVGEKGRVVGVDMTEEQLEVARRHKDYMAQQYSFKKSNVDFLKGDIENLLELDLQEKSFDCIISNCVVNLAEDKQAVLDGAFKLLKNGGEFYFSDVYSDRRIDKGLKKDPILYGECLSGALYWNDFLKMARKAGFSDPRKVSSRPLDINSKEVRDKVGAIQFQSITYRLFKIEKLEEDCEDFGQAVRYKGGIDNQAQFFQLDEGHLFEKGRIYPVCGNTFLMLEKSRFKDHFDFFGDFKNHHGIFADCGSRALIPDVSNEAPDQASSGSCC